MRRTLPKLDPYQIPVGHYSDRECHNGRERDRALVAMTVRMARAALGWSQAEFGRSLGMSQRAIHRIEQGHSDPRRTTVLAIENLLRKAGLKIQDQPDGGFSVAVPGTMMGEPAQPVDVTAPSLANLWPVSDEQVEGVERVEPARH